MNWDSFKWRNHQPEIGRFFNVDPLAEKYVYNSPYAFSENKVTSHFEIEGLEAETIHGAALKREVEKVNQAIANTFNDVVNAIADVVNELFSQHHEDVDEVRSVSENQSDPQATDTKWIGSQPALFNKDAVAKDGKDSQVMVTEGGQTETEGGRPRNEVHVHEVRNTAPTDTIGITGNTNANGEVYNSYYVIRNRDTVDNRHYVPDNMMPKKSGKNKVQN